MPEQVVDLLVIGGGPAGYSAAIRGSQLGKSVIMVERDAVGGTCLNRGCIPTKSLLESAGLYRSLGSLSSHGITVSKAEIDYGEVINRKGTVVDRLVTGLKFLLKQKDIETVTGEARFSSPSEVQVGERVFRPKRIVVSTGTESVVLPGLEPDGKLIVNSDQILENKELPESLLIVGGGVIGCEFATVFASFGVKVTIVELTERLLPAEDEELSKTLLREFKKAKIKVLTNAAVKGLDRGDNHVTVQIEQKSRLQELDVQRVLVSVGRRPVLPDGVLVETDNRGYIKVDESFKTSIDHVYAAGDIIGGLQLAHLAFEEGIAAVDHAFNEREQIGSWAVPRCVYTQPEISAVGLTEEQAKDQFGEDVIVERYSLKGNGKAVILGDDSGFCKIIADKDGHVLGVHMIGPHATELIAGAAGIIQHNMTLQDWAEVVHPHPTVSEAVKETVLAALGIGLHSV